MKTTFICCKLSFARSIRESALKNLTSSPPPHPPPQKKINKKKVKKNPLLQVRYYYYCFSKCVYYITLDVYVCYWSPPSVTTHDRCQDLYDSFFFLCVNTFTEYNIIITIYLSPFVNHVKPNTFTRSLLLSLSTSCLPVSKTYKTRYNKAHGGGIVFIVEKITRNCYP